MLIHDILVICVAVMYAAMGYVLSSLFKDPDFKTFVFIFWPLLLFYYFLYTAVSIIRKLVIRFIKWSLGGTQ